MSKAGFRGFLGSLGLLLLRVGAGGAMAATHGWAKLMSFSAHAATFPDPLGVGHKLSMGLAIFGEFFCAALVALGIKTRWAAVPVLFTMLVAFFRVLGSAPFSERELAFLYAVCMGTLILTGGGRYSVDAMIFGSNDF